MCRWSPQWEDQWSTHRWQYHSHLINPRSIRENIKDENTLCMQREDRSEGKVSVRVPAVSQLSAEKGSASSHLTGLPPHSYPREGKHPARATPECVK